MRVWLKKRVVWAVNIMKFGKQEELVGLWSRKCLDKVAGIVSIVGKEVGYVCSVIKKEWGESR